MTRPGTNSTQMDTTGCRLPDLAIHGPVGAVIGAAIVGLSAAAAAYVPVFQDRARERRAQGLREEGLAARHALAPRSAVPLLNEALIAHEAHIAQEQVTSGSST
jgi:hypothetical protein